MSRIDPEEHIKLLYFILKRVIKRNGGRFEDWLGPGWIAFTEAANKYDPAKGKFSTYASRYVFWKLDREHKRINLNYRYRKGGYVKIKTTNTIELVTVIQNYDIDNNYHLLGKKQKEVVDLCLRGWSNETIAKELGISNSAVYQRLVSAIKTLTPSQLLADRPPGLQPRQRRASHSVAYRGSQKSSD